MLDLKEVLAATIHRVEVQSFPQLDRSTLSPDRPGLGPVRGVSGLLPIRVETDRARRRLEEAMRQGGA